MKAWFQTARKKEQGLKATLILFQNRMSVDQEGNKHFYPKTFRAVHNIKKIRLIKIVCF